MADYTDIGFDSNLVNQELANLPQGLSPQAFDQFAPDISGSKVQGGVMTSQNGKVILDLEKGIFRVTDGIIDRVKLGIQDDGTIGLLIRDSAGNTLQQTTEGTNIIQSSTGTFKIDLVAEQLQVFETPGGVMRILLGRQTQAF